MNRVCWLLLVAGLGDSVSRALECTTGGRFPNNDPECRGYTMCLFGGPSGFMQYNITCPVGFVYTHLEQQCTNSTTYKCLSSFVCNTTGNFENPSTDDCSSFVACVGGINGIVPARRIECPLDRLFDPKEGVCTNNTEFKCNDNHPDPLSHYDLMPANITTDLNVKNISVLVNSAVDLYVGRALLFVVMIFVCLE